MIDKIYDNDIINPVSIDALGKDYKKLHDKLCAVEKQLADKFPQCKDLLSEYQTLQIDLNNMAYRYEFNKGFKVGAKIMLEVLENSTP